MTNYRKGLSRALTGSLRPDPDHINNLDTVHALGLTDPLGSALWRIKFDNDSSAFERAVTLLREAAGVSSEIAALCITEWAEGACRRCKGAAWLEIDEKQVKCKSCAGTGLHRFSDRDRAYRLRVGLSTVRRWSGRIKRAHDAIGSADIKKGAAMGARLVEN